MYSKSFTFFVLTKMVAIFKMSAKLATLGLLKIKVFWNKGYGVIIFIHGVSNKILSGNSNYIVDVVMWPKFGNSNISMREFIMTKQQFYKDLTRKKKFVRVALGSSLIIWDWNQVCPWNFTLVWQKR